jgi:hypothetical protein
MIIEFRTYTMRPGTRAEFAAFFEREAIPRMREVGMTVLGQFSSVSDENCFAYARTFDSIEQRERQYRLFYESEDWLGWMIDTAMGKEESFVVFLGDSKPQTGSSLGPLSGVHGDRFVLATGRGVVTSVSGGRLSLVDDDDGEQSFSVPPTARVFLTPNGRGMTAAVSGTTADISPGDRVLVLGERTADGQVARQIVRRPPPAGG